MELKIVFFEKRHFLAVMLGAGLVFFVNVVKFIVGAELLASEIMALIAKFVILGTEAKRVDITFLMEKSLLCSVALDLFEVLIWSVVEFGLVAMVIVPFRFFSSISILFVGKIVVDVVASEAGNFEWKAPPFLVTSVF